MAQEFASDNSKNGFFSRLKLSNHRGFFSLIFVSLSLILLLVTFAAVQQQQTTNTKAAEVDLCTKVKCSDLSSSYATNTWLSLCERNTCCKISTQNTCVNDTSKHVYCTGQSQSLCTVFSTYCEWKDNKCVEKQPVQTIGQSCNVATSNCYGVLRCINGKCDYPTVGVGDRCKSDGTDGYHRGDTIAKCQEGLNCSNIDAGTCVRSTTGTNPPPPGTKPEPGAGGGADSACTSLSGRCLTGQTGREGKDCKNIPGQAGSGKIQAGLCTGGEDRKCCLPKSSNGVSGTKVTCSDPALQTEATCKPVEECVWITQRGTTDTKVCQRACGRIPDQPTCDKRTDCGWKNNACISKTGTTDGGTDSVDLNLKLAFQGIVTLPKTKTEVKIKVKLVDAANREKEKDASTFTVDDNGVWSGKVAFENVDLSQKYYLLIKGPMHVQKKICKADAADPNPGYYSCQFGNITLTSGVNTFDFSKVKMLVGDLDQNGLVNREDTGPLLNALLMDLDQRKSAGILEKLDLNLDGIVEPKDWSLMLEALKIKYDEK